MIGALVRAVGLTVGATIALVVVAQLAPTRRPLAVGVYLLLLGALVMRLLVAWLRLAYPPPSASPFDAALEARPAGPRRPAELDRLARLLSLSSASALYAQTRLRSELRPVAADRLSWSRGVDLDADPDAASAALGETGWRLLRPDPGSLPERETPGLTPPTLADLLAALERIGDPAEEVQR